MTVLKCCGGEYETPFCPMCGRKLQSHPLSELLLMCREEAESFFAMGERCEEKAEKQQGHSGRYFQEQSQKAAKARLEANKYSRWALFLEAMMQYANDKDLWAQINEASKPPVNGRSIDL